MRSETKFRTKVGRTLRSTSQAFPQCPACDSKNLLNSVGEVFCLSCDWDSIRINADRHVGFDQIFGRYDREEAPEDRNVSLAQELISGPTFSRGSSVA